MESNEGECARAMWTPLFSQLARSPQRSARSIDHPSQAARSPFVFPLPLSCFSRQEETLGRLRGEKHHGKHPPLRIGGPVQQVL